MCNNNIANKDSNNVNLKEFKLFADKSLIKRKNLIKKFILTLNKIKSRQLQKNNILISIKEKDILTQGLPELLKLEKDKLTLSTINKFLFLLEKVKINFKENFEIDILSLFSKK